MNCYLNPLTDLPRAQHKGKSTAPDLVQFTCHQFNIGFLWVGNHVLQVVMSRQPPNIATRYPLLGRCLYSHVVCDRKEMR